MAQYLTLSVASVAFKMHVKLCREIVAPQVPNNIVEQHMQQYVIPVYRYSYSRYLTVGVVVKAIRIISYYYIIISLRYVILYIIIYIYIMREREEGSKKKERENKNKNKEK